MIGLGTRKAARRGRPSLARLFGATDTGFALDFGDKAATQSGANGLVANPAYGNTITAALDKSKGATLGAEIIPAGQGDGTSLTGWTAVNTSALLTLASGTFKIENGTTTEAHAERTFAATVGDYYWLEMDLVEVFGSSGAIRIAGDSAEINGAASVATSSGGVMGRKRFLIRAKASPVVIRFAPNSSTTGHFIRFDNVSIKPIAGRHAVQGNSSARMTLARRPRSIRNLLTYTEQFDNAAWVLTNVSGTASRSGNVLTFGANSLDRFTQGSIALPAAQHTASIILSGTGNIRLFFIGGDGTTGVPTSVVLTATPTRYSVTRTPAGGGVNGGIGIYNDGAGNPSTVTISEPQVEADSTATPYQRVVSSYDVTEAGVPSYDVLRPDYVDDAQVVNLPSATVGTRIFAGVNGCYVMPDDPPAGDNHAANSASGWAPAGRYGILKAIGDLVGCFYISRALSDAEIDRVCRIYQRGGAGGRLREGTERVVNGDMSSATGWSLTQPTSGSTAITVGKLDINSADGTMAQATQNGILAADAIHIYRLTVDSVRAGGGLTMGSGSGIASETLGMSAAGSFAFVGKTSAVNAAIKRTGGTDSGGVADNFSVKELVPDAL